MCFAISMADALDKAWNLLKMPMPPVKNMQGLIDNATNPEGAAELQKLHDQALPAMQDEEMVKKVTAMLSSDAGKQFARHLMIKFANMTNPDMVPDHLVYDKQMR